MRSTAFHQRDFVVAAIQELDETDAVAERVGHGRDLSPIVGPDIAFERGAGLQRAVDGFADVFDDDIEMHRRPVAAITAQVGARR